MKKIISIKMAVLAAWFILSSLLSQASVTGSFKVNGDAEKFYPVIFTDGAWDNNVPTELLLGRSVIHTDALWLGSIMSKFSFHTSCGGHGSNFINTEIKQTGAPFVAGWIDVTRYNNDRKIIIWLKGGGTTYYYTSNYAVDPSVYDGTTNPVTYNESSAYNSNGTNHTFKTSIEPYVNQQGLSYNGTAYFTGTETNSFAGNIGVGTKDTKGYKLAVAGNMIAESIKVQPQGSWADYVFEEDYKPQSLEEIESFVKKNKHLPEIPSAAEVKSNGIDLGEMNAKLLKKIEELTLYMIQMNKEFKELKAENLKLKKTNQ